MGVKQFGFGDDEQSTTRTSSIGRAWRSHEKRTRRECFLAEIEAVVPWSAWIDRIEPYDPKTSKQGDRPPYPLETMLRIHLM